VNNPGRIIQKAGIIASQRSRIEQIVSEPGWTLVLEEGFKANEVYHEVTPGELPTQLLQFVDWIRQLIDEIASVAQVQRGGMPYGTSGKAIQELLEAGDSALVNIQRNIEYAVTYWGENHVKNIQQFYSHEDALRISDDLQSYTMAWEYHTEEGEEPKLGVARLDDFEPGEEPKEPQMLIPDWSTAEWDVKIGIQSNQARGKAEMHEKMLKYYELGIVDEQEVIEHDPDLNNKRELLSRIRERNDTLKQMAAFKKMMEEDTPESVLIRAAQNPQVAQIMLEAMGNDGVTPEALNEMMNRAGGAQKEMGNEQPQAA
jgi:hypothetical protein